MLVAFPTKVSVRNQDWFSSSGTILEANYSPCMKMMFRRRIAMIDSSLICKKGSSFALMTQRGFYDHVNDTNAEIPK